MLQWLRRRRAAERLAQVDAEVLIKDHGGEAYGEARWRELDVILPDGTTHAGRTPAHWRRVALIVARQFLNYALGAGGLVGSMRQIKCICPAAHGSLPIFTNGAR